MTAGDSLASVGAHLLALEHLLARLPRVDGSASVVAALTRDPLEGLGESVGAAAAAERYDEASVRTAGPRRPPGTWPAAPTAARDDIEWWPGAPSDRPEPHAATFERRWPEAHRGDGPGSPAGAREQRWLGDDWRDRTVSSAAVDHDRWPEALTGDRPGSAAAAGEAGRPEGAESGEAGWRHAGEESRPQAGDDPWRAAGEEDRPQAGDDPWRHAGEEGRPQAGDDPWRTAGDNPWTGERPLLEGGEDRSWETGHGSVPHAAEDVRPGPSPAVGRLRLTPRGPGAPRSEHAPPDADVSQLAALAARLAPDVDGESLEPENAPPLPAPAAEPPEAFMDRLVAELELEYTRLYGPLEG